ncbi:hypothetical protein ACQR1I_31595 [Bradyrhizobium sp. HKCCYLS2038]|uniref:hypothetical protein n=1 Tax=unclassified Bradyrhizobium TaxID=2631580 RepID=UPI003EBF2833
MFALDRNGKFRVYRILVVLALVAGSIHLAGNSAVAHTDEQMAAMVGDHGGQIRASGNHHLELTSEGGAIHVWVTDHGNTAVPTEKFSGKATILVGEKRLVVLLTPAAKNEMRGSDPGIVNGEMRVILDISMPDEEPLQARFQLGRH